VAFLFATALSILKTTLELYGRLIKAEEAV